MIADCQGTAVKDRKNMAKILIVDDDKGVRALLSTLLSGEHTILEANNGQAGLHMFTLHKPDLIIMDLNMPYLTGKDLLQNLRALRNKVKIVVYSAFVTKQKEIDEVVKAGADVCLPKPAELVVIKKTVDELLSAYATKQTVN